MLYFLYFEKVADEREKTEEEAPAAEVEGIEHTSDQHIYSPYKCH